MIGSDDILFLQQHLTFWDKLREDQKNLLLQSTTLARYASGKGIHSGENDCIGIILVKSGRLRNFILSEEGKEVTLFRLNAGEVCVLSASCILKSITFEVHVEAEKDSQVYIINANAFERLCGDNVYAENFSYKIITSHFSEVMWAMEQILFMSFEKRLAIFLIDQSSIDGTECITMTHEAIARHMGSAREVVSRMLKYFQNEGIVELSRGDIKIVNKKRLREIAV